MQFFGRTKEVTLAGLFCAVWLLICPATHGATQMWNADGAGGGSGTWDTGVTPEWDNGVVWTDSNDAVFGGTGGTVTLVNPTANSVTFNSPGSYVLTGGTLNEGTLQILQGQVAIGSALNGIADIEGNGGLMLTGSGSGTILYVGTEAGSNAMATISGSGASFTSTEFDIGESGTGALVIANGAVGSTGAADTILGWNTGGYGSLVVTGQGSILNGDVIGLGPTGHGIVQVLNGGQVDASITASTANTGGTDVVIVTGSGSKVNGGMELNTNTSPGTVAAVVSNGGTIVNSVEVGNNATLALLTGGTVGGTINLEQGRLSLEDGKLQRLTLFAGVGGHNSGDVQNSIVDLDVGNGTDQISGTGGGQLSISGVLQANFYGITGQVTPGNYLLAKGNGFSLGFGAPNFVMGNVYNTGNFNYSVVTTPTTARLIVSAAATPLTTAYWHGANVRTLSLLAGNAFTGWTTDVTGTNDPLITPSATTDVIFAANGASNEGATVLGTDMTIKSLTISDTNTVGISGANPNWWLPQNTLTISGSTGTTGINVMSGAGAVTLGANVLLTGNSQTVTVSNAAGMFMSGTVGGSGGLTKAGAGMLTLAGLENYPGATVVNGGVLVVNGTISGGAADLVNAGGTLGGMGLINRNLLVSGTLAPGIGNSGAGATLNINGNLTFADGSQMVVKIDQAGGMSDLLMLAGDLGLGGNEALTIDLTSGDLSVGESVTVASFASESGTFSNIGIVGGTPTDYAVQYGANQIKLVAVVPEPETWELLGAGAVVLISSMWRDRRRLR